MFHRLIGLFNLSDSVLTSDACVENHIIILILKTQNLMN